MGTTTTLLGLLLGLLVHGTGYAGTSTGLPQRDTATAPPAEPKKKRKPVATSISHGVQKPGPGNAGESAEKGEGEGAGKGAGKGEGKGAEKSRTPLALTLDDGPDPTWTPKVLDLLRQERVKATFCLIGPNAERHPDLVKRIVAEGHRLCDHSMHHDTGMDQKPVSYQSKEILDAKRMIDKASGGAPLRYYRAPGGAFTPESRKIAAKNGMRPLGWTADSDDWRLPGAETIVGTVRQQVADGARIILMHDGGGDRSETYAALATLIPQLKQDGYAFGFPEA
ncbi:polysaccharide deacetylase family protein [Streptomyces sp. NPDC054796]